MIALKETSITIYPIAYLKLYKLLRDQLGYGNSIWIGLFDERSQEALKYMIELKILKWKGKNIALRRNVPLDFLRQAQELQN